MTDQPLTSKAVADIRARFSQGKPPAAHEVQTMLDELDRLQTIAWRVQCLEMARAVRPSWLPVQPGDKQLDFLHTGTFPRMT